MSLRPLGLPPPPPLGSPELQYWAQQVADAINSLPFSYFSTADGPNTSTVTAPIGTIGIEIGSSTTKLWIKETTASTGWSEVDRT